MEITPGVVEEKQLDKGPEHSVRKSPLKWRDVSQITAPSPAKGHLTPLSQSGFRDPASVGAGQQVTLMSIEVVLFLLAAREMLIISQFIDSTRSVWRYISSLEIAWVGVKYHFSALFQWSPDFQ